MLWSLSLKTSTLRCNAVSLGLLSCWRRNKFANSDTAPGLPESLGTAERTDLPTHTSDELDFSSFHTSKSSLFLMARLYDKLNNKDHNQDKEHKCKPWSAYSWHLTCIQAPRPRFKQGLSGFLANPYQCPGHPRSQQSILFVRLYHDFYYLVSCQVSTIVFRGIGIPVILFNENGLDDVKLPTWPSKQLRT